MKHITVWLPTNRWRVGSLVLSEEDGTLLLGGPCRGKADNQNAAAHDNPDRVPWLPCGDLPSGEYRAAKYRRIDPRHKSFGTGVLPLVGVSGDALRARENGRTGLYIHGGDREGVEPNRKGALYLRATYGCLRVTDSLNEDLMKAIGEDSVKVTVIDR